MINYIQFSSKSSVFDVVVLCSFCFFYNTFQWYLEVKTCQGCAQNLEKSLTHVHVHMHASAKLLSLSDTQNKLDFQDKFTIKNLVARVVLNSCRNNGAAFDAVTDKSKSVCMHIHTYLYICKYICCAQYILLLCIYCWLTSFPFGISFDVVLFLFF